MKYYSDKQLAKKHNWIGEHKDSIGELAVKEGYEWDENKGKWAYKQTEHIELKFLNIDLKRNGSHNQINISKHGMYFGQDIVKRLNIENESYILLAVGNGKLYVGRKPDEMANAGHKVQIQKDSFTSKDNGRRFISFAKNDAFNLPEGLYILRKGIKTKQFDREGNEIQVEMFEIKPV